MVTSEEYRHMPTGTLALLAQRLGKVFASPTTWYLWHIDTTLIRLLDGSRGYLRAVIDNFSRRILAWKVSATLDPDATAEILLSAAIDLAGKKPTLLAVNSTTAESRTSTVPSTNWSILDSSDGFSP